MWDKHLTESKARQILAVKRALDSFQVRWVERWIETLVRERSLPPQLASPQFLSNLMGFLSRDDALETLDRLRATFEATFPYEKEVPREEDFLIK